MDSLKLCRERGEPQPAEEVLSRLLPNKGGTWQHQQEVASVTTCIIIRWETLEHPPCLQVLVASEGEGDH